jgi:hypothetical protein
VRITFPSRAFATLMVQRRGLTCSARRPLRSSRQSVKRQTGDIAVPVFGHRNGVGINREHGLIRTCDACDGARGGQLSRLPDADNTASGVWADTASRSAVRPRTGPCNGPHEATDLQVQPLE